MADGTPHDMMPDETGNPQGEDNPLGEIDPMEWLESLAARQGATEGFTTQHNLDIAEIDPGSVTIDEPGYEPYESFGQDTSKVEAAAETPPPAEPAPPAPEPAAQGAMDMPDDVDPMEWLESLAARQGATEGFTTQHNLDIAEIDPDSVVIDEPGYTPSETIAARHQQEQPEEPAAEFDAEEPAMDFDFDEPPAVLQEPAAPEAAPDWLQEEPPAAQEHPPVWEEPAVQEATPDWQPEPPAAQEPTAQGAMDMPDDVDPMEWLETLAARQGATEGFVTQHNLDIAEIDPDSVTIDEPGYTPSETIASRHQQEQPEEPAAEFEFDQPPPQEQASPAAQEAAPAAELGFDDETEDFLATLGDELEPATNFGATAPSAPPDDLSWLDGLGSDPTAADASEPEAIPPTHTPDEVMASIEGYTDEQLAQMQAAGQLSGEQEFAWLQRQALTRIGEREEERVPDEDLPPAEVGEIPDWLSQSARVSDEAPSSTAFIEELAIPPTPEDVPDWLRDESPQPEAGATSDMELPDFTVESADTPSPIPEPPVVDSLEDTSPTAAAISDLKLEEYDPSNDEWAEALDEEHERMETGTQEDASWFQDAMDSVDDADAPATEAPAPPTPAVEPAADAPQPDWLGEVTEDTPPLAAEDIPDDLPDWLRPVAAATVTEEDDEFGDIGTWLREEESGGARSGFATQAAEAVSGDATPVDSLPPANAESLEQAHPGPVPAWAKEMASSAPPAQPAAPTPPAPPRAPAPSPKPAAPPPAPAQPQPTRQRIVSADEPAPPPAGEPAAVPETFEQYKSRLDSNPDDHQARIELARELAKAGQVEDSLPQYQTLVERSSDLNDVAEDLHSLIVTTPGHPALRRLLGDVYMRQGYLQEALDAYRGALDNL